MTVLQIPPHSRRASNMAVLALSAVAVIGFAAGLSRQDSAGETSPFPPPQGAAQTQTGGGIPDATPAPDMQVAVSEPSRRHRVAEPSPDPNAATAASLPDSGPPPSSADASATAAPDAPAPPPSPPPSEPRSDPDEPPT